MDMTRAWAVAGFVLAVLLAADVQGVTWDDGSGDHDWANGVNWSDDVNPAAGDTAFFDHTKTGASIVSVTCTVASLEYANTNVADDLRIAAGTTLTVDGGHVWVGYKNPNVSVTVKGGGTLQIGNASPTAMQVSLAQAGDPSPSYSARFVMTEGTFKLGNVSYIGVGDQAHGGWSPSVGWLDVSGATIMSGSDPNVLRVPALYVGVGAEGQGMLMLNPAVTNITIGTLKIGTTGGGRLGWLDLGTNSQLKTFVITNDLLCSRGGFLCHDSGGNCITGLPGNVAFRMGASSRRAGTLSIADGGSVDSSACEFGRGVGTFEAHLIDLKVGTGSVNGHYRHGNLDLRKTKLVALDVRGKVRIGGVIAGVGKVYLPRGRASCTNLQVGVSDSAGLTAGSGLLSLSNTEFVVSGDVTIGDLYDNAGAVGLITNYINGFSSGLDMTGTLSITNGGRMELSFAGPPDDSSRPYWGLRMAGNRTNAIASLRAAGTLNWSQSGLTARQKARFGVFYDAVEDVTFVGLQAVKRGTLVARP